jgi:hypothetical protein
MDIQQIVQDRGTVVCTADYDAGVGSPFYAGSAWVTKYNGHFYSFDDNDLFEGPYDTLLDALGEAHLNFGEVDITIRVTGMTPAAYARMMQIDAPPGHVVHINNQAYVLNEECSLVRMMRPQRTPARRRTDGWV